jgi:hypothetical protein
MPFKRILLAAGGIAALVAVPLLVTALAQDRKEESQHDRVANLSLTEKEELRRKRDQFERLNDEEKDRLRRLHDAIAGSPDRDRLESVTLQYHEWLKTLSGKQKEDLLNLPESQKLDEIKRLMQEQRAQRLRDLVKIQLEPGDARAIFTWIDQYATRHEAEMLALLPEQARSRLTRMPASPMRRGMLMMALGQRPEGSPLPAPTDEELKQLAESLSAKTRATLDKVEGGEEKLKLVQGWMRAAFDSQHRPPASNERLMAFFKELRPELRPEELEELENLPRDQFYDKLRQRYSREHRGWRGHRHDGEHRPPFGGRDGDGPRGGRDGDGRRDRDDDGRNDEGRGPDRRPRPDGPGPDGPRRESPRPDGPPGGLPHEGGPSPEGGPQRGFNRPPPEDEPKPLPPAPE